MSKYHCAERGCVLTEADLEGETCPTCGNPVNAIVEPGDDDTVAMPGADDDVDPPETTVRQAAARRNRRV